MFDFLNRKADKAADGVEVKASAAGPVIAMQGNGRVAWSPRDLASLTRVGFAGNPIGFRAVKIISEAEIVRAVLCGTLSSEVSK